MLIHINPQDRFIFHSAVATQDIQLILNDLNSQFVYGRSNELSILGLGGWLPTPVPMGLGAQHFLPYAFIEFETSMLQDSTIQFSAQTIPDGFSIRINHTGPYFVEGSLDMEFDSFLTLKSIRISYGALCVNYINTRRVLMNAAFMDLPTILGYIVDTNSRNRTSFTLGDPRQYNVLDNHDSQPVQNLGDILQFTNPRENPTGITKRPHERAGHTRQLSNGRIIEVSPTTVHRDEYEGESRPKNIKH